MKKTVLLAMLLIFALMTAALADAADLFAPYTLTAPNLVTLEEGEISATFVYGNTRVVAMVISRVPDEDAASALPVLMQQFDPEAVFGDDIVTAEGFAGMKATTTDKFGEGIDQVTAMVLHEGDLLILSGYNTDGDEARVHELIDALLISATVNGVGVIPAANESNE